MKFLRLFALESRKQKGRKNSLFILAVLMLQLAFLIRGAHSLDNREQGWLMQFYYMPVLNAMLLPALLALIASRNVDIEHQGSLWKSLYTFQTPRTVFSIKLCYGALQICLLLIGQCLMLLGAAAHFRFGPVPFHELFLYFGITFPICLVLYLLQLTLSYHLQNQAVSLAIGLTGSLAGLFLMYLSDGIIHRLLPWGLFGSTMFVRMLWDRASRIVDYCRMLPSASALLAVILWLAFLLWLNYCFLITSRGTIESKNNRPYKAPKPVKISPLPSECIKLRRSPVWIAFFLLPLISALIGTFNYMGNLEVLKSAWYSLWSQHTLFLCFIFMPAMIGVFLSLLWRMEHTGTNWNLLIVHRSPVKIIAGKLLISVLISALSLLWIVVLFFLCGRFAGITEPLPPELPDWILSGMLGCIVVCSTQLMLSLIIHSFVIPVGIAVMGGIAGLLITAKGFWYLLPYSLLSIGMRANNPNYEPDRTVFLLSSLIFLFLTLTVSICYLKKSDVRTQE